VTPFLVCVLVVIIAALLVDRFASEAAHRRERERLTRAVMARHMPEFAALQKIIEPSMDQPRRRLKAVGDERDPEAPMLPEGL
jgi:hypothetical protein